MAARQMSAAKVKEDLKKLAGEARSLPASDDWERAIRGQVLGAIHSLLRAHELQYDTANSEDEPESLKGWAVCLAGGKLADSDVDEWCLAGYYFNSGLTRTAITYELALKRLSGLTEEEEKGKLSVATLACCAIATGMTNRDGIGNLKGVWKEGNHLKHGALRIQPRDMGFSTLINAIREALKLVAAGGGRVNPGGPEAPPG